jgi:hypothetical protein
MMQSGELTVTGRDYADIPLHKHPAKVEVKFKDHFIPVPCNPHHHDELSWELHKTNLHHGELDLRISWSVTGVREIVWRVYY